VHFKKIQFITAGWASILFQSPVIQTISMEAMTARKDIKIFFGSFFFDTIQTDHAFHGTIVVKFKQDGKGGNAASRGTTFLRGTRMT
jgi:hypothetical protein